MYKQSKEISMTTQEIWGLTDQQTRALKKTEAALGVTSHATRMAMIAVLRAYNDIHQAEQTTLKRPG
jgi:dihydroxyacid dehydratase/phosphogluconate dehydratase